MLKTIRNWDLGWFGLLTALCCFGAGLRMFNKEVGGKTFLCFDPGCIKVQGVTVLILGVVMMVVGFISLLKRKQRGY